MTLTTTSAGLTSANVFSPASISGLQAWFKADAITPVADGTALATWPDSSGNTRDVVQATGANKPLYKTAIQNSKPVVRFNGTSQEMAVVSTGILTGAGLTILAVAAAGATGATKRLLSNGKYAWGTSTGAGAKFTDKGVADKQSAGSIWAASTWEQTTVTFDSSFVTKIYLNGALTDTLTAAASDSANAIGTFALGSGNGSEFWNGDAGEVLIYGSVLSATDRLAVEAYLKTRWATP